MVSSTHYLASQSAMAVLEDGGKRLRRRVAAGAASCTSVASRTVKPGSNGVQVPRSLTAGGEVRVLMRTWAWPRRRHRRALQRTRLGLDLVPGTGPLLRPRARRLRRVDAAPEGPRLKSLAQDLAYAIGYAEDRHAQKSSASARPVGRAVREALRDQWPSSARESTSSTAGPPRPRLELLRNPQLAATWKRLADRRGRERRAPTSRHADRGRPAASGARASSPRPSSGRRSATMDTSGERRTGTLTAQDLAGWSAT